VVAAFARRPVWRLSRLVDEVEGELRAQSAAYGELIALSSQVDALVQEGSVRTQYYLLVVGTS